MAAINEDDLVKALDSMMDSGVSRLKIDVDDNEGVRKKVSPRQMRCGESVCNR